MASTRATTTTSATMAVSFLCFWLLTVFVVSVAADECSEKHAKQQLQSKDNNGSSSISNESIAKKAEALALLKASTATAAPNVVQEYTTALSTIAHKHSYLKPLFEDTNAGLPFVPGEILVFFDETAKQQMADNTFDSTLLDALNQELGLKEAEIQNGFALYSYHTLYNPQALISRFEDLPGVESAEPNSLLGGSLEVSVNVNGDRFTFGVGWGDCMAGCIDYYTWSFCVANHSSNDSKRIAHMDHGCQRPNTLAKQTCRRGGNSAAPYQRGSGVPSLWIIWVLGGVFAVMLL